MQNTPVQMAAPTCPCRKGTATPLVLGSTEANRAQRVQRREALTGDSAHHVVEDERGIGHGPDAGDEWGERADNRHEAR